MDGNLFIALGSQKFQFNRLLKAIDDLYEKGTLTEEGFAQIGYSDYIPKNYKYMNFLNQDEFIQNIKKADIIITHGGTGAIINAIKREKKVIAVPRLAKYGEHVDNHQIQIIEQFTELNLLCPCLDTNALEEAVCTIRNSKYSVYESNTSSILHSIEQYIKRTLLNE